MYVSPAFNLPLVLSKKGCVNCNNQQFANVAIDGKGYMNAVSQAD
jgi:hypothetical protein